MVKRRSAAGAAQLRQREMMAQRGWASITTFIRQDTKQFLKELKRARELDSLHEALDLVLREGAGLVKASSNTKRQSATTEAPPPWIGDNNHRPNRKENVPWDDGVAKTMKKHKARC